jgi:hypothetical protein
MSAMASNRHSRRKASKAAHAALVALRPSVASHAATSDDGVRIASSLASRGSHLGLDMLAVGHSKGFTRGDMPSLLPGRVRAPKSHNVGRMDTNAPSKRLGKA